MTVSDAITIAGIIVTVCATVITVWQASEARKSSLSAQHALDKVRLAAIADRLRSAQEHIRALPTQARNLRGAKIPAGVARIRQEFDNVLGTLPKSGAGGEARTLVSAAQTSLDQYEASLPGNVDLRAWQSLQRTVQDAISDLTTAAQSMEAPHD